ncbi:aldo/keto reductase [Roseibium sp. CAU 1637]|uniref:Aldo/keto reductase n=1 Tax=Roseibium limicola TaxID=2816037 RepID=A0A939EM66_9HYPH|nr:aldo/keto reductase [Roseibium limicola]MBO0345146.1 aldo/keto reductase [Roseibium limicola]
MKQRKIGSSTVSAVGLGCMNYAHGYGNGLPDKEATELLLKALDLGYTHFDTATMYGAGRSETILGDTLSTRRSEFFLASKCVLFPGPNGQGREIDGRPERIKQACEDSLRRLKTDVIDLYYQHRLDRHVPIEESAGAFADLIKEGKIRGYGLSEVSAQTLRRAHAEHPVTALQSEYSLWTRNPEIATLEACRELGVTFVAFSPLARKFLSGKLSLEDVRSPAEGDMRAVMPRFTPDTYAKNLALLDGYKAIASELGCSMAELALAWVLAQGKNVVAIPGTSDLDHLAENARGADVELSPDILGRLDAVINQSNVHGHRYSAGQLADVETEEFA